MVHSNNGSSKTRDQHAAETVIAATAGRDTWQTWAGRNHGTEDFEYLDVFRGIKRSVIHNLKTKVPKQGTPCPICFCEPDDDESPSSFWHVTWCGHAVCKDCLGQYANSQVRDREQTGPLKCPVCLKILRNQDAVVAMMAGKHNASNEDIIKQWDIKMRNQLLRAIPSFRSCPKCVAGGDGGDATVNATSSGGGERNNYSSAGGGVQYNSVGGGFVTPECLGLQHHERREKAIEILLKRNYAYATLVLVYMLLVGTIHHTKSPSALLDLWSMLLPIYVFVKIGMAVNYLLATKAREALFRSISVECPCCDTNFVLPVESNQLLDEETSRWLETNTRPCPSCSVPISKTGGCNHISCSHCGANFCWACMRLRTACQAYRCQNGAPYRNSSFLGDPVDEQPQLQSLQSDGSVITYIDYILNHRVCPELRYGDGLLVLVCLVARHLPVVQSLQREILSPFLFYLSQQAGLFLFLYWFSVMCLVSFVIFLMPLGIWTEPPERRVEMSQSVLFILFISFVSPTMGVSMGVGYFVNEILPILRQQEQELPEREQGRDGPMPENPIRLLPIDELNQTILNEVLRRSIEDT